MSAIRRPLFPIKRGISLLSSSSPVNLSRYKRVCLANKVVEKPDLF